MDHVGIVVEDLAAAKAFFVALGFEPTWEREMQGDWVSKVTGLTVDKVEVAMVGLPGGQGNLELIKFQSPPPERDGPHPANALGIRHIAFVVDDIEAMVVKVVGRGMAMVGEIIDGTTSRFCYVRGPEGIIVEFAEKIS
jgi:catechol 2,3-dioxygenase-like lactoylglutathione lyase family enzyme